MKLLYPAFFSCLLFLLLLGGNISAQTQSGNLDEPSLAAQEEVPLVEASVETVYPVPAKSNLFIPIDLPQLTTVKIKVFDILGSEVGVLIHEPFQKGKHAIKTSVFELEDGHYFLTIEAGGSLLSTQKIVVLK